MEPDNRLMANPSEINEPHSKFQHVYAVVRIDTPVSQEQPENSIAVVKVLSSCIAAKDEASRLNKVNESKGCVYAVYTTRLVP